MEIQRLLNKARRSISSYCINECKAYCCRKGYLVLTQKEHDLILKNSHEKVESLKLLKALPNNKFSLYMGNANLPCPSLLDFKCTIHKSKNRPMVCHDFPIFIEDHEIRLSHRCPAVKEDLFYPYMARLKKLGYKIIVSSELMDSEFMYA
ncbi:MAG: YkgJ family cysteine cluster protein [Nanoarchaeota archaeon]|nr:YkgJ family cysteine cluster protein [Nanoarchaeota archaeon]MBU1704000.1 YkgJ family cysteine cluster protein [Nanoarchaeota archaeon]